MMPSSTPPISPESSSEADKFEGTSQSEISYRGSRFEGSASDCLDKINSSIDFDHRLLEQDIVGSKAHATMLVDTGIITDADGTAIQHGLSQVQADYENGRFKLQPELEDVHMNVESYLGKVIGPAAGRLHTARSRNDQVATDFKLWVRDATDNIDQLLKALIDSLIDQASAHHATVMPGFTHLQYAQPITFGHHCLAYTEMFLRDRDRFKQGRRRLNECPLGSAALAGTSFAIDRSRTAALLGFERPSANSLDGVSDRDFALDFLASIAIAGSHLSRLAEELVTWSTAQFRFVQIPDELTAGSSIMPQKRNPDAAELVRAKSGRLFGNLMTLLTVLKGLPLAYSKDLQEDKEPVFDSHDNLVLCLEAMTAMITGLKVNTDVLRNAASIDHATSTDLADWLVRNLDMPFREAHGIVGKLVRLADQQGLRLDALSLEAMRTIEPRITEDGRRALQVDASVSSRKSVGGAAPGNVLSAAKEARKRNGGSGE